jgi:FkbM family methyltransferase
MGLLKSAVVRAAEKLANIRIVRPEMLYVLPEQEHLLRFFRHFRVDCVFDVGANQGQYARMLRKHADFRGPIVSFEPIPSLAQTLRDQARHDPQWHIEEVALDRIERDASFNVMEFEQFSSLRDPTTVESAQFETKNAVRRVIPVHTATLQEHLVRYAARMGFQRPFLKMDTQGCDLEVARGAGPALRDFVGIQSEMAIKRLYAGAPTFYEALDFYNSQGFELSAIVPNNAGHFPELVEADCILFRRGAP